MKKLLPLFLILIGSGAGVGAGIFLRPELVTNPIDASKTTQDETLETSDSEQTYDHGAEATHDDGRTDAGSGPHSNEYAKLNNQFVVPIILQVLFDHANVGGFEGNFTSALELGRLRKALREVAQRDLGKAIIQDVLIMEIARQDY